MWHKHCLFNKLEYSIIIIKMLCGNFRFMKTFKQRQALKNLEDWSRNSYCESDCKCISLHRKVEIILLID